MRPRTPTRAPAHAREVQPSCHARPTSGPPLAYMRAPTRDASAAPTAPLSPASRVPAAARATQAPCQPIVPPLAYIGRHLRARAVTARARVTSRSRATRIAPSHEPFPRPRRSRAAQVHAPRARLGVPGTQARPIGGANRPRQPTAPTAPASRAIPRAAASHTRGLATPRAHAPRVARFASPRSRRHRGFLTKTGRKPYAIQRKRNAEHPCHHPLTHCRDSAIPCQIIPQMGRFRPSKPAIRQLFSARLSIFIRQ